MFNFPSISVRLLAYFAWVVSARVSAPYVITGSTHQLQTCLIKHVRMLPLKMSRYLANVVHTAVILL